jgi:UDP-glucuronate 4-epimerase
LWNLPTVITRINVPYGDNGGWPAIMLDLARAGIPTEVPAGGPAVYNPIHEDDIIALIPRLLQIAAVPAVTVNLAGNDVVSVQEWTDYLTELTGVAIPLVEGASAIPSVTCDLTKQHALVGTTEVPWRDGFRRMVEARYPELIRR